MHGAGCPKCGESGFRGRKGVFEIFVVNQEIEEMIYNNVSIVELRKKKPVRWACVRCVRMALEKFWPELPLWRRF